MAKLAKFLQGVAGAAGGAGLNVEDVFSTYLYTGNGSTQTITNGIDLAGEGGAVFIKKRANPFGQLAGTAVLGNDVGLSNVLLTHVTTGTQGYPGTFSFNADGFTNNSSWTTTNQDGDTYASWTFRKAPKFFDVVTYTGTGSVQTISHNLGSVPGMIIVKAYSASGVWGVYHRSLGNTKKITLNETTAAETFSTYWNNTDPTSTEFTVGTNTSVNTNGNTYVAYLFAHNDGDGEFGPDADQDVIKAGSFTKTDTGGTNFIEVNLGFEVQWLLVKATSESGNWEIWDVQRGLSYNGAQLLNANSSSAESSYPTVIRPTPNGFEYNDNNAVSYIYIAIRRGPMAVPESATDVFDVDISTQAINSSTPPPRTPFPVDAAIYRNRGSGSSWALGSRLQGTNALFPNLTNAESNNYMTWDAMDGWNNSNSAWEASGDFLFYNWKRAPNYFDVVAYTGNGTAGRTVSHNLGVVPEMMWVKRRDGVDNWLVYHSSLGATKHLYLNTTGAELTASWSWNDTAPTDTVFSVSNSSINNGSGATYIAYLFASLDGVSKVGSYTGTGAAGNQIDCGFSSGARFVLIKRSSGSQNWYVFDTERGIVAGNDPSLNLNDTSAEYSSFDYIDPYSSGFELASGNISTNASGETYIFYAIA